MERTTLLCSTAAVLAAAGLVFLWALALGVLKYRQIAASPKRRAHHYTDIARRSALLYSFAILLIAAFVQLSAWPQIVNLAAALVVIAFFVFAIGSYTYHGVRKDTTNQFKDAGWFLRAGMVALAVGEIGGFAVIFAGFLWGLR
ncbi:hypothetical protein [Segniliparus rugosus]|uniref:Integral membrane protein n=1 Tax=Segniliparus rugosus (strain ATCC BAA-974 / DSM 45345 / CCUG 50838 / CIP 108380 / JCM 13579 / CDC 945) TaxID=679197 RepID=E5XUH1_SEGRC|nr:hypothetical protein [Segniliparus rugosus]EFV11997.1 hypothetical protein HMPREF9336_03143 [Segniliparus rugosus ATCC BAA-974]